MEKITLTAEHMAEIIRELQRCERLEKRISHYDVNRAERAEGVLTVLRIICRDWTAYEAPQLAWDTLEAAGWAPWDNYEED